MVGLTRDSKRGSSAEKMYMSLLRVEILISKNDVNFPQAKQQPDYLNRIGSVALYRHC